MWKTVEKSIIRLNNNLLEILVYVECGKHLKIIKKLWKNYIIISLRLYMKDLELYLNEKWNNTLNILKDRYVGTNEIEEMAFEYFEGSKLISIKNNVATILVPTFISFSIINPLVNYIEVVLSEQFDSNIKAEIVIENKYKEAQAKLNDEKNNFLLKDLNRNYKFQNFITGRCNAQAHLAAHTIAENLGVIYNPLFIYGDSGLGKTHLLCAIGNSVLDNFPSKKIGYITGPKFVEEVYNYLKTDNINKFKEILGALDLLLVDDIQFIANKEKTVEIFFTIFNSIISHNGQIVLTADKTPQEINGLEQRLVTRFSQGLSVNIQAPEFETSVKIIKQKISNSVTSNNQEISDEVISYIATNFSQNVRALEGAITRLLFYSINYSDDNEVTLATAVEAFKDQVSDSYSKLDINKIKNVVSDYYNITKAQLISKNRTKNIAYARHIAIYLSRKILNMPYVDIGMEFGKRDHSTVMSSVDKIEKEIKTNENLKKAINNIESKLNITH